MSTLTVLHTGASGGQSPPYYYWEEEMLVLEATVLPVAVLVRVREGAFSEVILATNPAVMGHPGLALTGA
jgi:hypothetical protein